MHKAGIMVLVLALAAAPAVMAVPAWAGERPTHLEIVEELASYVAREDADFDGANPLYKRAKEAIAAEAEGAAEDDPKPAAARYEEIRGAVANAMRRDELPASAWIMGVFGASLMWGGLAFCIGVARKKGDSGGKGAA